ncbi:MAG TPA: glucuronate isomerase, partial [Blastocatellia bacterium]|nr:glucuronate isomerase [Blastocatellia bacterium]
DRRFHASLRLDGLLNEWQDAAQKLACRDIDIDAGLSRSTFAKVRNFLDSWIDRMAPVYMAVSLPDDFKFPDTGPRDRLIRDVVLPTAREHNLAFVLMIGVRRGVNPALRAAGDGVGWADLSALERMCDENPDVRFLATVLSRENQHELCVSARKFSNLMPFGCWWFLNNPSLASEITHQRLELLGPSFIPQHSDARVLEHLIYKWRHWRPVFTEALYEAYERLLASGRAVSRQEIIRDVDRMCSANFRDWVGLPASADHE